MTCQRPETSLVEAFRETTLCLIGLYRIYLVDPDLSRATADALRRLFSRYLRETTYPWDWSRRPVLQDLVEELDVFLAITESRDCKPGPEPENGE